MSLTPIPSAEACNQSLIYVSAGNSVVTSSVVISEYEYGASPYVLIYGTHNSILWDHDVTWLLTLVLLTDQRDEMTENTDGYRASSRERYRMRFGTREKVKSRDHSNVIRRTIQMYHESMCKLIDWSNSSDNNILLSA